MPARVTLLVPFWSHRLEPRRGMGMQEAVTAVTGVTPPSSLCDVTVTLWGFPLVSLT